MKEYTTPKTRKKILANLSHEGRLKGARAFKKLNSIPVVGIKDGKFYGQYESASDAERKLASNDIKVQHENIRTCCKGKRKSAGGIM